MHASTHIHAVMNINNIDRCKHISHINVVINFSITIKILNKEELDIPTCHAAVTSTGGPDAEEGGHSLHTAKIIIVILQFSSYSYTINVVTIYTEEQ